MRTAPRTRRQCPPASEQRPACLELLRERPREIKLAESYQRLDLVREKFDHTWIAKATAGDRLGEGAQVRVHGLIVIQRQREEPEN